MANPETANGRQCSAVLFLENGETHFQSLAAVGKSLWKKYIFILERAAFMCYTLCVIIFYLKRNVK